MRERLRHKYDKHPRKLHAGSEEDAARYRVYNDKYTVLRQIQSTLDIEEVGLSRREIAE
ncbi:hypothetical protein [Umezawaea sp. Da 62-37]|uniref:hypothetical protein n=1 Tax=Umezawaea sp. Da 62-37 TaxID=3075927 RepID=UPI0028F6F562|nr:hypothetical protein [Umezawaea sp. Da 62-37]WNV88552.1 hypothetical protein RM788_09710 [Umezawaea sp. Da 62-37]